jgi:hypothetical protein
MVTGDEIIVALAMEAFFFRLNSYTYFCSYIFNADAAMLFVPDMCLVEA